MAMKGRGGTRRKLLVVAGVALGLLGSPVGGAAQADAPKLDRTVLPIPAPKRPVYKELDARKVKAPPHFEVKAPAEAPTVVIVLIDDLGFGATTPFGGPIPTPTLARLA